MFQIHYVANITPQPGNYPNLRSLTKPHQIMMTMLWPEYDPHFPVDIPVWYYFSFSLWVHKMIIISVRLELPPLVTEYVRKKYLTTLPLP